MIGPRTDERQGDPSDCHTLWIGDCLPPMARACLRSFLRHGHRTILHTYAPLEGVPAGVEVRDAARILPDSAIIRYHRSRSVAIFANYFRYKLALRDRGFWVDCDMYCVRPMDFADDPVFGFQDDRELNNAVLRLEPHSALLADLLALFEERRAAFPWLKRDQRLRASLRALYHRTPRIAHLPWGSTGPKALTWIARKHGLLAKAQPRAVFYPLIYLDYGELGSSRFDLASVIEPDTVAVHLWNQQLKQMRQGPEPGSFLARLADEARGGPPALAIGDF